MLFAISRLIRLTLGSFIGALSCWVITTGLYRFGLVAFSKGLFLAGIGCFLLGLSVLVLSGITILLNTIYQKLSHYFSIHARLQRQLAFESLQHNQHQRLFASKRQQQLNIVTLKTARLSQKNTLKHLQPLAKSLKRDLKRQRHHLAKPTYQQLNQQLTQSIQQQDIDSLLKLQQYLRDYDNDDNTARKTMADRSG